MSKLESTKRHILIIKKLRQSKQATFAEIADYLDRETELDGYYDFNISKRTFARDLEDIGTAYGIYIKYDFSNKFYFIENEFEPEVSDRMFEAFDVYNALNVKEQVSKFVYLEQRRPQATEHLYGLLHAIKNQKQIHFQYTKYYKDHPENRTVEPLAIKEFKYRWYLFAKDVYDDRIKCYALDRLSNLQISDIRFENNHADWHKQFKHCFGIIAPNADEPSEVILSFEPFQGKYIKSLPLHATQKIMLDNDDELRIRLTVYLTHDFLMELLSHGDRVKVLQPTQLIDELKEIYKNALEKYAGE
ncbi:MAG: WYL domain-containing protein [Prevotellaceae bacterium]|jgi:predicted DNA-binding transcriptional regulator YafY|nr:WYL domain-containing protein [Prevotellaceae bacterium]